jgi:hypothetical protein
MTKRISLNIPRGDELDALLAIDRWRQGGRGDGGASLKRRLDADPFLSEHERRLFKGLIDGTAKKRRPSSYAENLSVRIEIAKSVERLERALPREKRTNAVRVVANVFGVSNRTVQNVLREFARE